MTKGGKYFKLFSSRCYEIQSALMRLSTNTK